MKAAIFDMDGTLLDSMRMWKEFAPSFARQCGIEWTAEMQKAFMTLSFVEAADYFCLHFPHIANNRDQLVEHWFQLLAEDYRTNSTVKPGVTEYLEKLKTAGIPCAVATMTEHRLSDEVLKMHRLWDYMDHVLTYEDVSAGKDKPDLYYEAARRLGATPADCIVFEDSLFAANTALSAGFIVYGVDDHVQNKEAQLKPICHRYIYSFEELL